MSQSSLASACSQPEQRVQRQDVIYTSDQVITSVHPNCCLGGCLAFYTKSSPICDLPITPFLKISMHVSHLLDGLSKHQQQAYILRSFERPLLCESWEQWLGKHASVVVKFFIYRKFDSASFPHPDSCTVNSRRVFTEKESVPGHVLCLSVGI